MSENQYPRVLISRCRWGEHPDVWRSGWAVDWQEGPGLYCIVETREDRYSEDEIREISAEYECPVIVDEKPMGRPAG